MTSNIEEAAKSSIADFIGPIYVGNILNWMLMGTLVVQVYSYYQRFAKDRIVIRGLVAIVFVLEIAQTVFSTDNAWFFMVRHWGEVEKFRIIPWSSEMIPFLGSVVAAIVQIFYAWRIWLLSKTRVMKASAIIIVLVAIAQCLASIITLSKLFRNPDVDALVRLHSGLIFWSVGGSAADVLITGCMTYLVNLATLHRESLSTMIVDLCFQLYTARSQTSWVTSETMLTRLINNTIQTGLFTVICACLQTFLFEVYTSKGKNFYATPAYILGKLYSNSLMLTLNLRRPRLESTQLGSLDQPVDTLPINYFRSTGFRAAENVNMYSIERTRMTTLDGETSSQVAQEEIDRAPKRLDDEHRKNSWELSQENRAIEIRIERSTTAA